MPKRPAACAWLQVHLNRLDGNEGAERLLLAFGDAVCLQVEKQICFTGSVQPPEKPDRRIEKRGYPQSMRWFQRA